MSQRLAQSRFAEGSRAATLSVILLVLGLAQIGLVLLAIARILDPGWGTVDAIGVLVGLGMAAAALAWTRDAASRDQGVSTRFGGLGIAAGLVLGGVWLSLLGGTFSTNDLTRLATVVACDVAFTVWLVGAARLAPRHHMLGFSALVAFFLSVRTVGEVLLFVPLVLPSTDGPGPNVLVIFVAGLVLFGWIVLATWEIALGAWLFRRVR